MFITFLTRKTVMARARKTKAGGIELTERQSEVLDAVRTFTKANGVPPTRANLGKMLNLKHQSSIDNHLYALSRKGWLKVMPGIERGIRLLREGVPLYEPKDFRRGSDIVYGLDEQTSEPEWIDFEQLWEIFGATPDLCLRIRGDAMNKAGLTDGGIVALRRTPEGQGLEPAQDGEVVAARVGEDVLLRRYHRIDERTVELRPDSWSSGHQAIRVDTQDDDAEIIGVMIGRMIASRR